MDIIPVKESASNPVRPVAASTVIAPRQSLTTGADGDGARLIQDVQDAVWRVRSQDLYIHSTFSPMLGGQTMAIGQGLSYIAIYFQGQNIYKSNGENNSDWRVLTQTDYVSGFYHYNPIADYADFPALYPQYMHLTLVREQFSWSAHLRMVMNIEQALQIWKSTKERLYLKLVLQNSKYWALGPQQHEATEELLDNCWRARAEGMASLPFGTTAILFRHLDLPDFWVPRHSFWGLHLTWH
jgi:hypothetical protein